MGITTKDLNRLSAEVRKFINKTDNSVIKFGATPTLTFEFPSFNSLGTFMNELDLVLSNSARMAAENGLPWREIGSGIYELQYGGIRIVLMHVSSLNIVIKE